MKKFIINAVSVSGQCHSITDAGKVFDEALSCLKYIWPMVNKGRAILNCSSDIESGSLIVGEDFKSTLSRLKTINGDIPRLWYQYTVNRPTEIDDCIAVKVSIGPPPAPHRMGNLHRSFLNPSIDWISFGGDPFNQAGTFLVDCGQQGSFSVRNIYTEAGLINILPQYKLHTKHREDAYYDYQRKEHVAAMPIRDEKEAGILLRNGIVDGSDIISYHNLSKRYFRFKLTGNNIFHGFQIDISEVPPHLKSDLLR